MKHLLIPAKRFLSRRKRLFLYFLIFVAVFGNIGTLICFGQYLYGCTGITLVTVLRNFATYTIAIAVTAFADHLVKQTENDEDRRTNLLVLFGLVLCSVGTGALVLIIDKPPYINPAISVSAVVAAIIWFAVNGDHPNLVSADAYSTLGKENPME